MENLPQELIVEILLRLPVKSLIRFRCVSKSWLSLISNPQFSKSHFKRASQYPSLNTHKILLSTSTHLQSFDYEASFDDDSALVDLNFPLKKPDSRVKVLGSCNGLICIALDDFRNLFIWNPSTGDYKKLPDLDISLNGSHYIYGFGYDLSSNDYKVVMAICSTSYDDTIVKVFTMRSNSWRNAQQTYGIACWDHAKLGSLLNGALHCAVTWDNDEDEFCVIIAFDLAEERFQEVSTPDVLEDENVFFMTLGVIGGCLCVSCCVLGGYRSIELWVMKEYGVKESWTKLYRVSSVREIGQIDVLCFTKIGDIVVLNNGKELIKCCPEKYRRQHFLICGDMFECEATVYMESLLSPNAMDEIERSHQTNREE